MGGTWIWCKVILTQIKLLLLLLANSTSGIVFEPLAAHLSQKGAGDWSEEGGGAVNQRLSDLHRRKKKWSLSATRQIRERFQHKEAILHHLTARAFAARGRQQQRHEP